MEPKSNTLVGRYTTVLFILAGLAILCIPTHQFIIETSRQQKNSGAIVPVMRFIQTIEAVVALFCLAAGVLRARSSPLAKPVTAATSILLIFWVPFGTIAFFYWYSSVRKREA